MERAVTPLPPPTSWRRAWPRERPAWRRRQRASRRSSPRPWPRLGRRSAFRNRFRGLRGSFGLGAHLFLHAGRSGDGRDREVAGDRRPHAFRQRHMRDVQRVVDVEAGEVGDDRARDGVGRAAHIDRMAHDVEHAAALDARRGAFIDEMHRNVDRQARAFDDAQEIDMDRTVADRVELEVARDGADLLAIDVDRGKGGEEATAMDPEVNVLAGKRDRDRGLLAAVDHGRNLTITTRRSGGPLAHLSANRRRELV
jgi:hypothetical protein